MLLATAACRPRFTSYSVQASDQVSHSG